MAKIHNIHLKAKSIADFYFAILFLLLFDIIPAIPTQKSMTPFPPLLNTSIYKSCLASAKLTLNS